MPKRAKKQAKNEKIPVAKALTDKDPKYPSPTRFRCALTTPQQATLYAMLKMETEKKIYKGTTSAAVLSNPVGSGKTANLLALITEQPIPPSPYVQPTAIADHGYRVGCLIQYKTVLKSTVIFVNRDLIFQWQQEIKKFNPNLSCYTIANLADLEHFQAELHFTIPSYDIILVKNGDISRPIKIGSPETGIIEPDKYLSTRSIICNFGRITRDVAFARVVFDDFDTAKMPRVIPQIGSLFTWFVSATEKKRKITKSASVYDETKTLQWHCENPNIVYAHILGNKEWIDEVSIFVDEKWQNSCTTVGTPVFYIHKYINQNKKIVDAIGLIAGDKVSEVMQALNSDYPVGAAKAAGIEAEGYTDFLGKLLKKRADEFKIAQTALMNVSAYKRQRLLPTDDNPNPKDTFNQGDVLKGRVIVYGYKNFKTILNEVEEKYTPVVKAIGDMLKTFASNITANKCKICLRELLAKADVKDDDDAKFFAELGIDTGDQQKDLVVDVSKMDKICAIPCCPQSLYHYMCAVRGCYFTKEGKKIMGRCPTAKHPVDFGLLTVIDPAKLASGTIPDNIASIFEEKKVATFATVSKKSTIIRTKTDGILDIVRGAQTIEEKTVAMTFAKIMIGTRPLGDPIYVECMKSLQSTGLNIVSAYKILKLLKIAPRVLIFAQYDATLLSLCKSLDDENIRHKRLIGTTSELNNIINDFTSGKIDVLVVNSMANCSGLNLQFATDLVFYGKIVDTNIETQVIGRVQREGRKCNARIHYMLYDTE